MKSIGVIITYFGKFPLYFDMWLSSAKRNSTIDFIVFTDNVEYRSEENIRFIHCSFEEIQNRIQSQFSFKVSLNTPYELTKIKPAYGLVFREEIKNYDFWGFCDVDLVFGDIRKFLTDDILSNNEKILSHGHLQLFKNNDDMRKLFSMKKLDCMYYKNVFCSEGLWNNFDEYPYGLSRIANRCKVKTYDKCIFADLDMFSFSFKKLASYYNDCKDDSNDIVQYFEYNNGKLIDCILMDGKIQKKELLYVHFQKRKMACDIGGGSTVYYIVPNKFVAAEDFDKKLVLYDNLDKLNNEYCEFIMNESRKRKKKVSIFKKIFSIQIWKRTIFLLFMKKVKKVYPYSFKKGKCL